MECEVCKVRSAVGRCEDTQVLVCEECSTGCYGCGKLVVASKAKITKSGHAYCGACYEKRAARKAGRLQEAQAGAAAGTQKGLIPTGGEQAGEEGEGVDEIVVLSKWTAPPPWKMSAMLAGVGLAVMLILLAFPSLAVIPLGSGFVYTAVPLLFIPALAIVWAVIGFVSKEHYFDRSKCYLGIGLAVVAIVLSFLTMNPPAASLDKEMLQGARPAGMTPEQREEWRQRMLSGQRSQ